MKRKISLLLVVVMLCSLCITAFAAIYIPTCEKCGAELVFCPYHRNTKVVYVESETYCETCKICRYAGCPKNPVDYSHGTKVVYEGTGAEEYTITVPAELKPGESGTVTLSGIWATDRMVHVTADETVTLTNSINANDQKVLDVTFLGISEAGSNTGVQTFTEAVSVADIQNALFGTWSGKFYYNVEMTDVSNEVSFIVERVGMGIVEEEFYAPVGSTWGDFAESDFVFSVYNDMIYDGYGGYVSLNDVLVSPADEIIDGAVYTVHIK